jgi:hypothetical protein
MMFARWAVILGSFSLGYLFSQRQLGFVACLPPLIIGLCFLCLPNFAFHLVGFDRQLTGATGKPDR